MPSIGPLYVVTGVAPAPGAALLSAVAAPWTWMRAFVVESGWTLPG